MARYKKKPVVIEAWQYPKEYEDLLEAYPDFITGTRVSNDHRLCINTLEGDMSVGHNDYIIRGIKGEFYPCKPDIFAETYDDLEALIASDRCGG